MRQTWTSTLWFMRIACPLTLLLCSALGAVAWSLGRYELVAVNAFCAGVNAMLTSIQWFWFKP